RARDYPTYFSAIHSTRTLAADDAMCDPRTREFAASYLQPHHITSMMDVAIWRGQKALGILCCEHVGELRSWRPDEQDFAATAADTAALAVETSERMLAETKWQLVIHKIQEAVFVFDRRGDVVLANPRAKEMIRMAGTHTNVRETDELLDWLDARGERMADYDR